MYGHWSGHENVQGLRIEFALVGDPEDGDEQGLSMEMGGEELDHVHVDGYGRGGDLEVGNEGFPWKLFKRWGWT